MPEEINRILTDSITNYFFTTSKYANDNLKRMGVSDKNIFFVGNTMIDTLMANIDNLRPPDFMREKGGSEYFILTLHRPANVDSVDNLEITINEIGAAVRGLVIFPSTLDFEVYKSIKKIPKNFSFVDPCHILSLTFSKRI